MQSQSFKTVIAVIITAFVVGGGVYIWQKQPAQEDNAEKESLQSAQETVAPAESEPQWQVISDTKIGYTIQYPPSWLKVERDNGFDVSPGVGGFGMGFRFYDKTENSREELIGQIGYLAGTERSESRSEIEINGLQATKVNVNTSPPTDPTNAVVFEGYGKIFVLSTQYSPEEFERFYKSFRLTN
jgi:hypothetical protein